MAACYVLVMSWAGGQVVVSFGVLGPVQIRTGGELIALPVKPRTVLAVLVLDAGQLASRDRLMAALWPVSPPASAVRVLRTYVSLVRQSLRLSGPEPPRLVAVGGGYRLEVAPADVDQLVFAGLAARGRQALADGDAATALRLLDQALGLWRGEPAEDVTVDDQTGLICAGLAERRLLAEEDRSQAGLLLGRGAELVAGLRALVAAHPLRERLCGQLMSALYQTGQQAAALAAYQRVRALLGTELGVQPGPGLRGLYQQILAGEVSSVPQPGIRAVPASVPASVPALVSAPVLRQLPADTTCFAGRAAELDQLDDALATGPARTPRITVLTGTAGVGKTALAIHWAQQVAGRFPDGQLYVNLRGYDREDPMPPAAALGSFLRALGMAGSAIPAGTQDMAAAYRSLLAGRAMLIVLDNAADAEQVRPLLPAGPACLTLVTSRDAMAGLIARDGAVPVRLDLLPHDDAAVLLTGLIGDRAAADPGATARLAACCCRLPLALRVAAELATARPSVPLAVLAGELEQRQRHLELLEAGGDRQTAVREVFAWSVRRLDPAVARGFAVAALHPGPDLDAWALAAMTGTGQPEADRTLRQLARTGLVQPVGTARYTMHDLLRAFGRELAGEDGGIDADGALAGLLGYLRSAAAAAVDILYPAEAGQRHGPPAPAVPLPSFAGEQAARVWLDAERETLLAVAGLAAGDGWPQPGGTLASIVHPYLAVGGYYAEAVSMHDRDLRAAELAGDRRGQADVLIRLGHVYRRQSRYQPALRCFERSLGLAIPAGDPLTEYQALFGLALIHQLQGRYRQAVGYYRQILDLGRSAGSEYFQIRGLFGLGSTALDTGRYARAARQLQEAASICRATGERIVLAPTLINLGYLYLQEGRYREATEQLEQSVAICRDTGNHVNGAFAACQLALAGLRQGQYRQPETQLREALTLFRANGHQNGEACALIYLGELQLRTGRCQLARQDLERAALICERTGELPLLAEALNRLGEVFLAAGDPAQARARHHDALTLAGRIGDLCQQAHAHRGLGNAESALGNNAIARRHRERAGTRYAGSGEASHEVAARHPHPVPELIAAQPPAQRVRLSVREHALLTAYVSGMTLEAAARQVGIRPTTAKTYLRRVKAKYQAVGRPAHTKLELARRVWEEMPSERTT
jgi:DNA-binding SARP family transcriptional activator/tetratricopeptide (TPR) repeat protein/DNA-binding CsgD family transcriptional regulator